MQHERYLPSHSDQLLGLPVDVRALRLLQLLVDAEKAGEEWNWVHAHNLLNPASWTSTNGRRIEGNLSAYLRGLSEAWAWLVGEGRRPDQSPDACFVTARPRARRRP